MAGKIGQRLIWISVAPSRLMLRKLRRQAEVKSVTRLQYGQEHDNQLRIVAEAADQARDLLRNMEHAQMLHVAERNQLRELLGD
jgi:hypothetical protein